MCTLTRVSDPGFQSADGSVDPVARECYRLQKQTFGVGGLLMPQTEEATSQNEGHLLALSIPLATSCRDPLELRS